MASAFSPQWPQRPQWSITQDDSEHEETQLSMFSITAPSAPSMMADTTPRTGENLASEFDDERVPDLNRGSSTEKSTGSASNQSNNKARKRRPSSNYPYQKKKGGGKNTASKRKVGTNSCVPCQRSKIKCYKPNGYSDCVKCQEKGIPCLAGEDSRTNESKKRELGLKIAFFQKSVDEFFDIIKYLLLQRNNAGPNYSRHHLSDAAHLFQVLTPRQAISFLKKLQDWAPTGNGPHHFYPQFCEDAMAATSQATPLKETRKALEEFAAQAIHYLRNLRLQMGLCTGEFELSYFNSENVKQWARNPWNLGPENAISKLGLPEGHFERLIEAGVTQNLIPQDSLQALREQYEQHFVVNNAFPPMDGLNEGPGLFPAALERPPPAHAPQRPLMHLAEDAQHPALPSTSVNPTLNRPTVQNGGVVGFASHSNYQVPSDQGRLPSEHPQVMSRPETPFQNTRAKPHLTSVMMDEVETVDPRKLNYLDTDLSGMFVPQEQPASPMAMNDSPLGDFSAMDYRDPFEVDSLVDVDFAIREWQNTLDAEIMPLMGNSPNDPQQTHLFDPFTDVPDIPTLGDTLLANDDTLHFQEELDFEDTDYEV